nr:class II apurinic/apyrimidinic(AP)-endonuclease [Dictyostelium discoideum]
MTSRTKKLKMDEEEILKKEDGSETTSEEEKEEVEEEEEEDKKRKLVKKTPAKKAPAKKAAAKKKSKDEDEDEEEKEEEEETNKTTASVSIAIDNLDEPKVEENQMKIISWNVAGFKSVLSKGFTECVEKENPDVLCLQETKINPSNIKKDQMPKGYEYHFIEADQKGHHGTGVLTKKKPNAITFGIGIAKHDNEGRVITLEYVQFYIVNTYIPNAGTRGLQRLDYRIKEWDVDFQAYLEKLNATKPIIWCGDLNVAHTEIDLKNPKTNKKSAGFTIEERTSFSNFLEKGYVDSYRHFNPGKEGSYTFWSYLGGGRSKNVGWRLDYFVVSKRLMDSIKISPFHRTSVMGSDHCPIGVVVDLN